VLHGYRRTRECSILANLHVRGYKEEGTTTMSNGMVVRHHMDRFSLASMVIDRLPALAAAYAKQAFRDALIDHQQYIVRYEDDSPAIRDWRWTGGEAAAMPPATGGRAAGQPAGVPGGG
jgi:xylulose-5-phosphate/fructose-6-phosphate phosphoketolase